MEMAVSGPAYPCLPEALESGSASRRPWTQASGGCWKQRFGWVSSMHRTARRPQPEFDRRHRAAGRLQARHHRAMGLRLRPRREGHRVGRHPPRHSGRAAAANLLFGDVSPGAKLPFTRPRTVGQVRMVYAHTRSHAPENQGVRYWDEASTPLFPFGYGLSYGCFEYANLAIDQPAVSAGGSFTMSVEVTNSSAREADEIIQLYLHQRHVWVGGDSTAQLSASFEVTEA